MPNDIENGYLLRDSEFAEVTLDDGEEKVWTGTKSTELRIVVRSDKGPAEPVRQIPRRFYVNLVLLLVFGVAASAWLLHYTDSFETVGGLLALGGLFSWLAFVSKALPDSVLKAIQGKSVDLLEARSATLLLLVAASTLAFVGSFFGSVRVEVAHEGLATSLTLDPNGQHQDEPSVINSGKPTHYLRLAEFMKGVPYRMKVPGLPSKRVILEPWSLNKVYIPNSFNRRVFLVRPSKDVTLDILNNPINLKITVKRDKRVLVSAPVSSYFGYSFWVNCSADVEIPRNIQMDLLNDVPYGAAEKYKALWFTPRPTLLSRLSWPDLELHDNDELLIAQDKVNNEEEMIVKSTSVLVTRPTSYDDATQVVVLERK